MRERLQQLGWSEIEVIDEDLGRSASGSVERTGFERMVAEVSLDQVGAVAAREVSRFARNSRDWQRLVEVCRVVDTLLVDQDAIYDPRRSNDCLLLGLKGSLNEYELDLLRHRAQEARREKALRGELIVVPPVGYVQGEEGVYEKDPDRRVQQAIRQVFEKFLELGSVWQVLFWFVENDLQLPTQHYGIKGWQIRWRRPNYAAVYRVLTHPIYAGAYVYGMTQTQTVWNHGRPRKITRFRPREKWLSLLPDRHEGYLGWEQFQGIQQMIADNANWPKGESCGAVKGGAALLAGIVRCRRLAVERHEIEAIHPLPDGPWIFQPAELQREKAKQLVERIRLRKPEGAEPNSHQRCPNLDRGEIEGGQDIPMGFEEGLPSRLSLSLRHGLDAMGLQDIADGRVGGLVAKIGERTLDAIVTPGWVLTSHAQHEFDNLIRSRWPPDLVAARTVVPFGSHQFPMPAQDRIGNHDSGNLLQRGPAEDLAFHRQTAPLVIVEQDAFLAELFFEDLVLGTQVLDSMALPLIDPPSQNQEQEVPGFKNGLHTSPNAM